MRTEFDKVANVKFLMDGKTSEEVAAIAIRRMLEKKLLIIPGMLMKASYIATRFLPNRLLMSCSYHIQHRKNK